MEFIAYKSHSEPISLTYSESTRSMPGSDSKVCPSTGPLRTPLILWRRLLKRATAPTLSLDFLYCLKIRASEKERC